MLTYLRRLWDKNFLIITLNLLKFELGKDMLDEIKKVGKWIGIIVIISIVILNFWYFEIKKIETLTKEIVEESQEISPQPSSPPREIQTSEIPLATPAPGSNFILPEAPLFEKKEEISPYERAFNLPILMYHHINYLPPDASKVWRALTVSPATFEKQMKYLFEQNYQPITFEKFINYLNKGEKIPERSLIITFDDGWENQYQYAFPVLKKYNFPATFFVVVNYIGGSKLMNWEQLKELIANGMEIGSHSMNHPNLRGLSEEKLKYEIQNSKIILEKNLGQKINVFGHPYGAFDPRVTKVVKDSNYLVAVSAIEGVDQNLENVYTLKRIQVYDNLYQFEKIFPPEE